MIAVKTDSKRRLTMPPTLPPSSAVFIQEVDGDTWLVRRVRPVQGLRLVTIPVISRLPDDPEWQALEVKAAEHAAQTLPPPEP